ncbi:ABC transporter substrate-binding protein [Streptomyces harbinensis]|uniref:ABC transporter substrate-binding protein n=1 Tax=Streptomyces harbinensis TaxID=1176198 RepID=UPI0033920516
MTTARRSLLTAAVLAPLLIGVTACGYGSNNSSDDSGTPTDRENAGDVLSVDNVNIGYFANITHATAVIGLQDGGLIERELGGTTFTPSIFNAGPSAIEALNGDSIDVTFIGPNPAINGWAQSGGRNLRIVSGAASGGASLVVNPDRISGLDDLEGATLATPQLGNTQDVALLSYLADQGFDVDPTTGAGEVDVVRIANAEIPTAFEGGDIDGAWVPEPTAAKLINQGAVEILDEAELWENGQYVVTHVIAAQSFLEEHPDVVEAIIRGVVRTNAWINEHPEEAKEQFNAAIAALPGGSELPAEVLDPAFDHVEFLNDPLADSLRISAESTVNAGLLDEVDLAGIYDLSLLNRVLAEEGLEPVSDGGLGVE